MYVDRRLNFIDGLSIGFYLRLVKFCGSCDFCVIINKIRITRLVKENVGLYNRSMLLWRIYAHVYDEILNIIPYQEHVDEILETLFKYVPGGIILDAGCGTGNLEKRIMKRQGDRYKVEAVDISRNMLKYAKSKCKSDLVNFNLQDLNKPMEFTSGFFSAVVMINVLYSLKEPKVFLSEVNRVLSDKGILVLSTPHDRCRNYPIVRDHFKAFVNYNWQSKARFIIKLLMQLPFFLVFLVINMIISAKGHYYRSFNFFSEKELEELIINSGLRMISIEPGYSKQNWLLVAQKS